MQAVSSITITPPEPAIVPAAIKASKSMPTSISSAVSTFAEMPPGMTALSLRPPHPFRIALDELRAGHTHRGLVEPGRWTWPQTENSLVPPAAWVCQARRIVRRRDAG